MNKEQVTAGMNDLEVKQDLYRLHKLEKEYNDLSDKCNKLYTFIYSLDFADKVRNADEQILLQEQHKRMEAYRTNLYQRIQFYRNLIAVSNGYDILTPWCEVAEKIHQKAVESATNHCGQDAVNFEQLSDNLTDTYKDYCRGVLEQFLSREITWAKFVEKVALPFCHENINEFVNVIKDNPHHSRPGREKCQVGDGSAAVEKPVITGESLKQLMDYQVIGVCEPGFPCEGCVQDHYNTPCVKVELVGGYFLCLAPLPNSIVTE